MKNPLKYYAIGDIHGRIKKLNSILEQIEWGKDGTIVFLGDYVGRGRDSRKVLDQVMELVDAGRAVALKGNHDDMMVRCWDNPHDLESIWWKENYLKPTRNSYYGMTGWDNKKYEVHVEFIRSMPLTHETNTFHFSHSGDSVSGDWLWGRPGDKDFPVLGKYNVHGHTPVDKPFFGEHRCNLDTGAAWKKGVLTCALFEEGDRTPLKVYQSGR